MVLIPKGWNHGRWVGEGAGVALFLTEFQSLGVYKRSTDETCKRHQCKSLCGECLKKLGPVFCQLQCISIVGSDPWI